MCQPERGSTGECKRVFMAVGGCDDAPAPDYISDTFDFSDKQVKNIQDSVVIWDKSINCYCFKCQA